tara:strand:+ start:182 stop:412 length:231 start_codon:yes stop_codon:yes gene_type:complete
MSLQTFEKYDIQTGVERALGNLEDIQEYLEQLVEEAEDDNKVTELHSIADQVEECLSTVQMVLSTMMYKQWKKEMR